MFVPGPVDVADEVLQAQAMPMLPHRSREFEAIFRRTSEKAQQLFYTKYRVFLTASSGTGLQEAAVRNFVNKRMLSVVNGAFADRWHEVAVSNGKDVEKLSFDWDTPAHKKIRLRDWPEPFSSNSTDAQWDSLCRV
jgi:aspartate aminotransferase-like enzyme